jgi:glycyl-tRNA synthetase beta chain
MTTLLLELFSEEIPAGMQKAAAKNIAGTVVSKLEEAGLKGNAPNLLYGPRRIAIVMEGIPDRQPDRKIERKGPKPDAAEAAINGFLKSTGLSLEQLEIREIKGEKFYFAVADEVGKPASIVVKEVIESVLATYVWPKSMRWGANEIRWVRPLQSILCLLGDDVLPVRFGHTEAGKVTYGHRFMAPDAIVINHADEYEGKLEAAKVIACPEKRRKLVSEGIAKLCVEQSLKLNEDEGLLNEVIGLVEWPHPIMGNIEPRFMELPPEVLITVMKNHQRYFTASAANGNLAPVFITISNIIPKDGGAEVIKGNSRVLRARLSDAEFFYKADLKRPFDERKADLRNLVFHQKLGTVYDKTIRLEKICFEIYHNHSLCDRASVMLAAKHSKSDLLTNMVSEFPELQAIMGSYYIVNTSLSDSRSASLAIRDHYKPQGPGDRLPETKEGAVLAIADKIDTICGFFIAGEKPTSSSDPYSLRRSALGIIRIAVESTLYDTIKYSLPINSFISSALSFYASTSPELVFDENELGKEIFTFFLTRFRFYLEDKGFDRSYFSSVAQISESGNFRAAFNAVKFLKSFVEEKKYEPLLLGYKRCHNILSKQKEIIEASKGRGVNGDLLKLPEEKALHNALRYPGIELWSDIHNSIYAQNFDKILNYYTGMIEPLSSFFDQVLVDDEIPEIKANRLILLRDMKQAFDTLADFSEILGLKK